MLLDATLNVKKRKPRIRAPKHPMVCRAYRFPLDVSEQESAKLFSTLHACWILRNMLAEDRSSNRTQCKERKRSGEAKPHYLNRADQYEALKLYAKQDVAWGKLHSQVRQNIAVRIDEGYKRFFEALKEGRKDVKPPKPIIEKRHRSFTYPQYGTAAFIRNGKLHLSNLGDFHVRGHRKIHGLKKTVTVKWMQGHWWVIITAMIQEKDQIGVPSPSQSILYGAGDTGIVAILTESSGKKYDPPRAFARYQSKLRTAQKKMSRQFEARKKVHREAVLVARAAGAETPRLKDMPYSNRLKKQIVTVAKIHARIENIRDHYHKKTASEISSKYREFAVEEHGVQFMIRNRRLAKAASDRAIAKQKLLLRSKLGSLYHEVPTSRQGIGGNSQTCVCGASVPKTLKDRIHNCPACGLVADRDHVSANIVQLIAFGTTSPTLYERHPGRMSIDMESSKCVSAKAVRTSRVKTALESPVKRQSLRPEGRNTNGGEPTLEDKTSAHFQNTGVAA
jgi:putative transposase